MVIVTNEPYAETEPILINNNGSNNTSPAKDGIPEPTDISFRRNSYVEAYKNITSSMKGVELDIRDPKVACDLLTTGINLRNMPLIKQCVQILDAKLDPSSVLSIFSYISKCKMPSSDPNGFAPSAPPLVEGDRHHDNDDWVRELTDPLRHNCLLEIDRHADLVLQQPQILDLSYSDLLAILGRDTLAVSSEPLVYCTVIRWAVRECDRKGLEPLRVNIQAVVRDLRYTPRYGLMTKKEFCARRLMGEKGPTKSDIFDVKDWRKIQFYIKERANNRDVEELPRRMSKARTPGGEKPRLLSEQSSKRAMECPPVGSQTRCQGSPFWDKVFINVLTCWATVFD